MDTKTTDRAGMLTPMAKVSVAKRTFTSPRPKRISVSSFITGSSPPWCTPMPRRARSSTARTWCQSQGL